jgi:hypothetical protein
MSFMIQAKQSMDLRIKRLNNKCYLGERKKGTGSRLNVG